MRLKIRFINGDDIVFEHVEAIHENDKYIAFKYDDGYKEICIVISNILFIEKKTNE